MTEVISVRFRSGCKSYYFDPRGLQVKAGEHVIVETASGSEYATCCEGNHEVEDQSVVQPLRSVVRIATENDRRTDAYNREREKEAFAICEKQIAHHKLDMKLIRVESNFDASKIIFFFTAEGRVDFRELVKTLANVFRARIELRQVGVRDEAKMIGGIGICGRPLCCSQFLDEFVPVSIKMAKTQNLSLNPTKISGTCGRLMCCLKYEQNAYEDASKRMPKNDSFVNTPDGIGNISSVDLLREEVKVRLDESPESPKCYKRCEIEVLRNGKGSREGIEIPKERPARYIRPEEKEIETRMGRMDGLLFDFADAASAEAPTEGTGEKRSQRRRSRRRGQEKQGKAQTPAKGEGVKVERIPVKVSGDLTAEKKAAADRKVRSEERRSGERRGGRSKAVPAQSAEKTAAAEKSGEAAKAPRRRHRPRRRRSGGEKKAES